MSSEVRKNIGDELIGNLKKIKEVRIEQSKASN
jgi:hypothetical protein